MAENSIKGLDTKQRKHYLPLESNPEVFTQLIHALLGTPSLEFHDVFSIDEPGLLAMIPRPVFALVLVFPTTEAYEKQITSEEASREEYTGSGDGEDVVWFKQTIHNACGLYAILHGVSNVYDGGSRLFTSESNIYMSTVRNDI
jgi:ubiquitin carboxyl-terminal hydrolase L3